MSDYAGTVFDGGAGVGGNYWSDFHTPAQGCNDVNPWDGYCDSWYVFTGGVDQYPFTRQDGWNQQPQGPNGPGFARPVSGVNQHNANSEANASSGKKLLSQYWPAFSTLNQHKAQQQQIKPQVRKAS